MPKKKESVICQFRTSKENMEYVKKLQNESEFDLKTAPILQKLFNLGIAAHKKQNKKK